MKLHQSMRYRSDIDGLRAIAIIPVVLFHLEVPGFTGGFVGVDIFFVISGFLITSIIYKEMLEGCFSFSLFYERRIRRLFPSLFFVLIIATISSLFILVPEDMRSFSQSLVAATIFGANLLFWRQSGYFDGPALEKPLLHTWSLSVEEQFYVGFPVLLILLIRYMPKRVGLMLVGMMLVSFAASAFQVTSNASSAFYLSVYRAWELLLGALLAVNIIPNLLTHHQRHFLSLIGGALIAYSVYSLSSASIFPGVNALYPCIGAALIIFSGSGGHPSAVGKVLGWQPLVFIGLISYSLYLWHWPLIVFAKYYLIRELLPLDKISIFVVATALAIISWRYVERPFRGKSGLMSRSEVFKVSSVFILVLIFIGLFGHFTRGFPQRIPSDVLLISDVRIKHDQIQKLPDSSRTQPIYAVGATGLTSPSFLVWGDSHAAALRGVFDETARKEGKSGFVLAFDGCRPLMGVRACVNEALPFFDRYDSINTVVLLARWALDANGSRYKYEGGKPLVLSPRGVSGNGKAFQDGLKNTIQFLLDRNIRVIFVNNVPEIGWNVTSTLLRAKWYGRENPYQPPSIAEYNARQQPVSDALTFLQDMDFRVIDTAPFFCSSGICMIEKNGFALYSDTNHLNANGAEIILPLLKGIL